MDARTLELLRALQGASHDSQTLAQIQGLLASQRKQLAQVDDRATLADISELLEVWAEAAEPALGAVAVLEAARIAQEDLEQPQRAAQLFALSLELDPRQTAALEELQPLLRQEGQHDRLEVAVAAQVQALRQEQPPDDARIAQALRTLGQLRAERPSDQRDGKLDAAIAAYEEALELDATPEIIRELADLYARRGGDADRQQAADLYYALGDALGNPTGLPLLELALDQVPGHEEALDLLEAYVPIAEQAERLRARWSAYIDAFGDSSVTHARRKLLARVHAAEGHYRDALMCIAPLVERDDPTAQTLREAFLSNLEGDSESGRTGSSGQQPRTAPSRALPPRSGATEVGFKVPEDSSRAESNPAQAAQAQAAGSADTAADRQAKQKDLGSGVRTRLGPTPHEPSDAQSSDPRPDDPQPSEAAQQTEQRASSTSTTAPPRDRTTFATPASPPRLSPPAHSAAADAPAGASAGAASPAGAPAPPMGAAAGAGASLAQPHLQSNPATAAQRPSPATQGGTAPAAPPAAVDPQAGASLAPMSLPATPTPGLDGGDALHGGGRGRRWPGGRWGLGAAAGACALALAGAVAWGSKGDPPPAPSVSLPQPSTAASAEEGVRAATDEPVKAAEAQAEEAEVEAPAAAAAPAPSSEATAASGPDLEQSPEQPGDVRVLLRKMRTRGGKLSRRDVGSSLRKNLPQIERCYAKALRKRPRLQGRTVFSFTVDRRGAVRKVKRVSSTVGDRTLYRCSAAAIKKTRFPKPKRRPARVRLPLAYRH